MPDKKICVVGAGPSGLTTTKTLLQAGLDVDCFEMSSFIGGHWVLNNPNGLAASYASLCTNTPKGMSRFSDFDMPESWPDFPTHEQVREWLESYIDAFGFREHIYTSTEVMAAIPQSHGGWKVTIRRENGQEITAYYDALVASSGVYRRPNLPNWPGVFSGEILQARDYIDPTNPLEMAEKRVVVVGIGNTGCELACEIGATGAKVYLSARSGNWIMPKTVNGIPTGNSTPMANPSDPIPAIFKLMPAALRTKLFQHLAGNKIRKNLGESMRRLEALGLPPVPKHPFDKRPTLSDALPIALENRTITAKPGIERLDGNNVIFTSGERVVADIILCATGYGLDYPYLDQNVVDTSSADMQLFMGVCAPDRSDLFFVGFGRPLGAFWPMSEAQAKFAAAALSGKYQLPTLKQMQKRAVSVNNEPYASPGLYALSLREEVARGRV